MSIRLLAVYLKLTGCIASAQCCDTIILASSGGVILAPLFQYPRRPAKPPGSRRRRLLLLLLLLSRTGRRFVAPGTAAPSLRLGPRRPGLVLLPPPLLRLVGLVLHQEHVVLYGPHLREDDVDVAEIDLPAVAGDVIAESGEDPLVHIEQKVERADADVQAGQVGEEIVADEEAQEYNVVDEALEGHLPEGDGGAALELVGQILPQYGDRQPLQRFALVLQQLHGGRAGLLVKLSLGVGKSRTLPPPLRLLLRPPPEQYLLPQYVEVGLVRGQRQHDEVGIQPVQDVDEVGIVVGLRPLEADVGHDLVLPLPGDGGIAEDDADVPPRLVGGDALPDVEAEELR